MARPSVYRSPLSSAASVQCSPMRQKTAPSRPTRPTAISGPTRYQPLPEAMGTVWHRPAGLWRVFAPIGERAAPKFPLSRLDRLAAHSTEGNAHGGSTRGHRLRVDGL